MFRILPDTLRDKIIFLYEKGMSAAEAAQEVGLHEAKVSEIYAELGSLKNAEALLDMWY
jgi:DNA-directed RNA polymerase specialized sigma24 family protein